MRDLTTWEMVAFVAPVATGTLGFLLGHRFGRLRGRGRA
jgi:hypothetical protein